MLHLPTISGIYHGAVRLPDDSPHPLCCKHVHLQCDCMEAWFHTLNSSALAVCLSYACDTLTGPLNVQDGRLSLIHIPLKCYATFMQPLLQLLHPNQTASMPSSGFSEDDPHPSTPWASQHPFLNVSITPIECSVVCSTKLAQDFFAPVIAQNPKRSNSNGDRASISAEDFVVISVEGEGLDAGQRVLELTSPLAMAGMCVSTRLLHQTPPLTPFVAPYSLLQPTFRTISSFRPSLAAKSSVLWKNRALHSRKVPKHTSTSPRITAMLLPRPPSISSHRRRLHQLRSRSSKPVPAPSFVVGTSFPLFIGISASFSVPAAETA